MFNARTIVIRRHKARRAFISERPNDICAGVQVLPELAQGGNLCTCMLKKDFACRKVGGKKSRGGGGGLFCFAYFWKTPCTSCETSQTFATQITFPVTYLHLQLFSLSSFYPSPGTPPSENCFPKHHTPSSGYECVLLCFGLVRLRRQFIFRNIVDYFSCFISTSSTLDVPFNLPKQIKQTKKIIVSSMFNGHYFFSFFFFVFLFLIIASLQECLWFSKAPLEIQGLL